MGVAYRELTIEWFGYATVRIERAEGGAIYFDPGRHGVLSGDWEPDTPEIPHPPGIERAPADGDLVFLTHDHHYDPDGIDRVASEDATVIAFDGIEPASIDRDVADLKSLDADVQQVSVHEEVAVADVDLWTIPAYNDPDGPHVHEAGDPHHPKGSGIGFLVAIDGIIVLFPGDTDVLPGHRALEADVFLPPIGGAFTMDRFEAAELVDALRPDLVVPIHYNTHGAIETDDRAFAVDVASRGVPVALDR